MSCTKTRGERKEKGWKENGEIRLGKYSKIGNAPKS